VHSKTELAALLWSSTLFGGVNAGTNDGAISASRH
jgi:hypothetical protein